MKILIIGNGQVGSALTRALKERSIFQWTRDIDELSTEEIIRIHPQAIINAAGKTDLARCEEHAREAFRSNVEAPVNLYRRISLLNQKSEAPIRFFHFSSGCIWDGPYDEEGKPFTPDHPASPAAYYSWTKAACDLLLLARNPDDLAILRPRQVYSSQHSPRNTISKLNSYPKLVDTPNSMSSIEVIVKTIRYCLDADTGWSGIWNIYDSGIMTPFRIGTMLAEAGLREMPHLIEKSELDSFHTPKRVDTVLYDERFEKRIRPDPIETVMRRTIAEFSSER